jgi:hypothetical protein
MFKDEHRRIVWDRIRQQDLRAFAKWVSPELVTEAALQAGVRVGQGPLYVVNLAWLTLSAALRHSRSFAEVLTLTMKVLADTEGFGSTPLGKERRKARRLLPVDFWQALLPLLVERFEAAHGQWLRWKRFRLLALDGTRPMGFAPARW